MKKLKKTIYLFFALSILAMSFTVVACPQNNGVVNNKIDITIVDNTDYIKFEDDGYYEQAEIERKIKLIKLAKTEGEWQTSDIVIKNALKEMITKMILPNTSSSALTFKLLKQETLPVSSQANPNRSSKIPEFTSFDLLTYQITSSSFNGHAITSTDKRIGNIIAVIESEYEANSDCEFAVDFKERFNEYAQHIADLWNSITDDDIANFTNKVAPVRTPPIVIDQDKYIFGDWVLHSGNNSYILKTKWGQSRTPFNNCVMAVKGNDIKNAGCTTAQVAQIMAFHKVPREFTSTNLARIKRNWDLAIDWDGVYSWDVLTKQEKPDHNSMSDVQIQIGAFYFDIAEGCKANYKPDGTGISNTNRNKYFLDCGYTFDNMSGYSLKNIKKSIDSGYPVPMTGDYKKGVSGHAFIVDGYCTMSCTATKKDGSESIQIMDEFVHCNAGWYGKHDGYYISGVFAMDDNHGALKPDNTSRSANVEWDRYFQYNLTQLNMLRPK